jgi:DNA-binding SARP family transcriptional activator
MLFLTGRAQEGLEVAERLVARSRTDATEAILAMARFQNGDPESFRDAWPPAQGSSHGNARDDFLIGVYTTAVHASFGIAGDLDFVRLATERSREQAFAALSKAMHHVAAGNEPAAVEVFSEHLQAVPLEDPMNAGEIGKFAPYSYVLSTEARDWLDNADLGPKLAQRRQLGRALVDARAGRTVDWSVAQSHGDVFCGLALPWSVELAAWWAETDVDAGSELLEYLTELAPGHARNLLRSLADGGANNKPTPAAGARAILSHVPAQPEVPLHLQLCGALRVGVGVEEPATSPTRGRVRQLLSLLTLRKEVRREEAIDLLWPDTDPAKARNSLRVTLGYLRDALEPDRVAGEASFHLRATADTLRLRRSPALCVDVWDIEAELKAAQALEVSGHHQQASEHYKRAAALWSGEAWQDLRGSIDLMAELSVFDQRIAQAVAQAGEWSYTTGDFDEALVRAEQVLENDPYNERGHRLAISALIALGRSGAAAQARDRCLRALSEFGVRPSEQTEMVLRRLRASA